jgi:prevent-host-death family protein
VKTINQRTLRNDNATVLNAVEAGEDFVVTRNGQPIARLTPYGVDTGLAIARSARHELDLTKITAVQSPLRTQDVLDELRAD